MRRNFGLWRS